MEQKLARRRKLSSTEARFRSYDVDDRRDDWKGGLRQSIERRGAARFFAGRVGHVQRLLSAIQGFAR